MLITPVPLPVLDLATTITTTLRTVSGRLAFSSMVQIGEKKVEKVILTLKS